MKRLYLLQIYGGDIIELSNALVREFAEVMEVPQTEKTEKFLYGTIKNNGESSYVKFDGSDFLTPITSAMGYEDGDRVMVMMKDHRAIVTSNMTSPGVSQKYVKENCASFDTVSAINARIDILDAGVVKTSELDAAIANIGYLKSDYADLKYASISSLNASNAEIENLKSTTIKTTELYAKVADLDYIKSDHADIVNLKSTMITTDTLKAEIAKIGYLTADEADIRYLTVSTANATFLHADMSDMDIAKIQTLFATAGIVSDMTIKDGHITGVLDSVTVNANSITTGTLSVDRLVIRGSEKSLVYELNNISGALQAKSVDTLNGEILTQRTITADKLVAKSITSNEIKAGTITSDEIAAGTIKAANINVTDLVGNSAFINSLKSNTVIVGLQNDVKSLDNISTKSYTFSGSSGKNWVKLGTLVSSSDARSFIITVYTGDGYNASPTQNSKLEIIIKNSWQSAASASGAFGVSTTTQNWNNPKVKVMASSSDVCDVWIHLPWVYWNGNYTISGYRVSWTHSGAVQSKEPTSGTAQNIECRVNAEQAKSVADSAVSTIGKWCYNNDITYINGGKIYTGTVTADKLAANSVTADKILAGAITADKLAVDAITSRNYVKDTSGTKISLADGSYDSKYTKISSEGKIECSNIAITGDSSEFKIVRNTKEDIFGDGAPLDVCYSTTVSLDKIEISRDVLPREDYSTSLIITPSGIYTVGNIQLLEIGSQTLPVIRNVGDVVTSENISLRSLSSSLSALQTNVATYYQPFGSSGASLKSGQNLNEFYSGVILGAGMGNAPDGDWWLVVSGGTGGTTVQRAYNLWSGRCNWRYCASGNWTAWQASLSCGDITGTGAITISNGNMTSAGVITNALRTNALCMPTRTGAQTTAKPNVYFDTAGNLYKTSTTSSKRFKEDVKLVENEDLNPENLYDIDVVQFKYKKGHFSNKEDPRYRKDMIGFIAENVYEHYPMAADYHIGDDGNVVCDGWNEQYLIPAMLKLIQDQHKRILELEKGIQNG